MSKSRWRIACLPIFVCSSIALYSQVCGGTERWQVKVGTGSGVNSVRLRPHIQTDLQAGIHLPEPTRPPQNDNNIRPPEETHVTSFMHVS